LHTFARRSVFSTRAIKRGEPFTPDNVAVLRRGKRGSGLEPHSYDEIIGRAAERDIPAETPIQLADVW
jgi:sialic acid synthase SpsE